MATWLEVFLLFRTSMQCPFQSRINTILFLEDGDQVCWVEHQTQEQRNCLCWVGKVSSLLRPTKQCIYAMSWFASIWHLVVRMEWNGCKKEMKRRRGIILAQTLLLPQNSCHPQRQSEMWFIVNCSSYLIV